ncbi:MAG TPA: hypothetical protein VIV60_17740, partial [Polyangiaceae bacterium]
MDPNFVTAIARHFATLSAGKRDILAILGLVGPRNVTQLADLVRAGGVRETATRAHSAVSLRKILEPLVERRLVTWNDVGYDCVPVVRQICLRDAVKRGVLDRIAAAVRVAAHPYLQYSLRGTEAAWFDFRVAILRRDLHKSSTLLADCAQHNLDRFLLENPLVEAVCAPFDPQWVAGFGAHRAALLAWTLDYANRTALPCYGMFEWLTQHAKELVNDVPELRILMMEAALLRGEDFYLPAPASASTELGQATATTAFDATRALLRGDDAAALEGFEKASNSIQGQNGKRSEVALPRIFMLFHGLALVRRGAAPDLSRVNRLATSRNRDKSYEFRDAAMMLKRLAEGVAAPAKAEHSSHLLLPAPASDCMSLLLRGLYAAWFDVPNAEREWLLPHLLTSHRTLTDAQYPWLAQEYLGVAQRLDDSLAESERTQGHRRLPAPTMPASSKPKTGTEVRSLLDLYRAQPSWLLALQALDQLVTTQPGAGANDTAQERIAWRVNPENNYIEPLLQKRSTSGWSNGRKVAAKQLLADGAQYDILTPADRLVTAHICEEANSGWGGYVNRVYYVNPSALLALVDHPLVYVEPDLDVPVEIARGQVRLRAESVDEQLVIRMDPPLVSEQPKLVKEGQRWVVYALDKQQAAVAKVVGQKLAIPNAGKPQTLDV